jgi:hypothetical protein
MMLIKKTHQGDKSAADSPEQRKKAIDLLQNLRCRNNVIAVLYNEFNRAVKAKNDLGCPKDEDSDLGKTFLGKLPGAYAATRAEWSNHRRIWGAAFPYPKTIVEAYEKSEHRAFATSTADSEDSLHAEFQEFLAFKVALRTTHATKPPVDDGTKSGKSRPNCTFCNKLRHAQDKCYIKH